MDTGLWVALLDERDPLRGRAEAWFHGGLHGRRFVTTQLVLIEVLNHFSRMGSSLRRAAASLVTRLHRDSRIEIVPLSASQFAGAAELYGQRLDKAWSLADCASFQIMPARHMKEALTHDHHFVQAGFTSLLRSSSPSL